jgi:pimeloyl-ACP methyl ester carboxylesterase
LAIGAGLIAGFAGQLYLRQDTLVFRPRPMPAASPADVQLEYEDVWLQTPRGVEVHGWWVAHQARSQVVLFFHGSDGNLGYQLPTLRFLHSLGTSVFMIDYPGYGRSGGRPTEKGCYEAAEAAWTFLLESKRVQPADIIVFGQSLGSAVATYLSASRACGGLVFQSGFSSVPDMAVVLFPYLPVRLFCRTRMNSLARIAAACAPILCLHSPDDEHIPIAQALKVYGRAPGPKRLVRFPGSHTSTQWRGVSEVGVAWKELLDGRTGDWEAA